MIYAEPRKAKKCLFATKFIQPVKTRPNKPPACSLLYICILLLALTALAESQMGLRRNWSFLETPSGAPDESDLWFSGQECIDLPCLITENSYDIKVSILGVIWPLQGSRQHQSPWHGRALCCSRASKAPPMPSISHVGMFLRTLSTSGHVCIG